MPKQLEKIKEDLLVARKERDKERLSTLSLLICDIDNEVKKNKGPLSCDKTADVIRKHKTKLLQEVGFFKDSNRPYEHLLNAIEVVENYLPLPYTDEEVMEIVIRNMEDNADIPTVMKKCKEETQERFDAKRFGPLVSNMVRSKQNS